MSNFDINNVEHINTTFIYRPSIEALEESKNNSQKELKELPLNLIINPWKFWISILSINSLVSFIGYLVVFTIIYLIFSKNNFSNGLIYTLLFLLWIGPIILFTPLILVFAISNTLSGNFRTPIGCGPRIVNGAYVDCM